MPDSLAVEVIEELVEALSEISPQHSSLLVAKAYLRKVAHPTPEGQQSALPRWIKKKPCYTCGADIFFGGVVHINKFTGARDIRWMPMHPVPIDSNQVVMDAVTLMFDVAQDAAIILPTDTGVQWFPHRVFCGMEERPEDPALAEVWDKTNGKDQVAEEKALEAFLKVLEDTE